MLLQPRGAFLLVAKAFCVRSSSKVIISTALEPLHQSLAKAGIKIDTLLLEQAMTCSSTKVESNKALAWLGDSVLDVVVRTQTLVANPGADVSCLEKIAITFQTNLFLARIGEKYGLLTFAIHNPSLTSDLTTKSATLVEALIGAAFTLSTAKSPQIPTNDRLANANKCCAALLGLPATWPNVMPDFADKKISPTSKTDWAALQLLIGYKFKQQPIAKRILGSPLHQAQCHFLGKAVIKLAHTLEVLESQHCNMLELKRQQLEGNANLSKLIRRLIEANSVGEPPKLASNPKLMHLMEQMNHITVRTLAGLIFLDSECNLDTVRCVFQENNKEQSQLPEIKIPPPTCAQPEATSVVVSQDGTEYLGFVKRRIVRLLTWAIKKLVPEKQL